MISHLVQPHGGPLVQLMVSESRAEELGELGRDTPSWDLTPRQLCDLDLLMNGGFSPLRGFMCRADYDLVCSRMRLASGVFWPIPITLDVTRELAATLRIGSVLALRDPDGVMLAALHVDEVWEPDLKREAEEVFGTNSLEHPGVAYLLQKTNPLYVGGRIEGVALPDHYDFVPMRLTPLELRQRFASLGWHRVIAFQTRNPIHRAHQELTFRAARELEANLLIHPVVGQTKPGDVDHYTRVRCYQAVIKYYPRNTVILSLLPLAMRMAGPREACWHAIIRKNYGCTHLIVGRDHAGPGADSSGKPFYGPYDAQELFRRNLDEIGVQMVDFKNMVYLADLDQYVPDDEVPPGAQVKSLSGTELRERLAEGRDIPSWFSFPEVVTELRRSYPPRAERGFTVFFTGLPRSGKSTLAKALMARLLELGDRPVTLLDGDIVRKQLSSELGFSKEHRDINIRRIGFVASEITKNRGVAVCAPIAPYDGTRRDVRAMIEATGGGFILVYVSTPIEVCEKRDRTGVYSRARAGIVKDFTGVAGPYDIPKNADLTIDTTDMNPEECTEEIVLYLRKQGYTDAERGV